MTRFGRAISHLKSTQIDEKIKVLNKELEKTGVLAEQPANSTASLYYSLERIPAQEEETTAVPDPDGWTNGGTQDDNGGDVSFGGITEAVKNLEQKPRKFLVDKLEVTQEPGQSEMRAIIEAMYNDIDDVMPEDRKREFYKLYAPQMLRKGEMDETEFKFIQFSR